MKKLVTLLLIILLTRTLSFSQDTLNGINKDSIVLITPKQLQETNLIFAEHYKLLQENLLLKKQVINLKENNTLLSITDSLRVHQLNNYKQLSNSHINDINILNNEIKRKNKIILSWKIGSFTVSAALLIWLILK